tara:strand:+ start:469 stop:729 length:261 start_codon:yes stop_codon:yes gene_type:complete
MSKNKQLIFISAPFGCGFCKKAQAELPSLCESKGWELIELINDEKGENKFPVESYPTFMVRIDDKMVDTLKGYGGAEKIGAKLDSY